MKRTQEHIGKVWYPAGYLPEDDDPIHDRTTWTIHIGHVAVATFIVLFWGGVIYWIWGC